MARILGDRYRLVELLGDGAMAEVWAADDEELGRRVAVKLLREGADGERFEREARAVAALGHANVVGVFDYGVADGRPYIVLEYLPGGSLAERLRPERPLAPGDAMQIARDVAAGLAHAHARGLVHRDLKPANILFDSEGRAKIGDFGIARMGAGVTLTEAGTVLGTPAYLSPEQAAGERATPASDVYSFGAIVYQLIVGRAPFEADDAMQLLVKHRTETPVAPSRLRGEVPAGLERVAMAALAKDARERPSDGEALLALLLRAEGATVGATAPDARSTTLAATAATSADVGSTTVVVAPPPRRAPARGFRRGAIAATAAILGAAGLGLAFLTSNGESTVDETTATQARTRPARTARTESAEPTARTSRGATTTRSTASTPARTRTKPANEADTSGRETEAPPTEAEPTEPAETTAPPTATTADPPTTATEPPPTVTAP